MAYLDEKNRGILTVISLALETQRKRLLIIPLMKQSSLGNTWGKKNQSVSLSLTGIFKINATEESA